MTSLQGPALSGGMMRLFGSTTAVAALFLALAGCDRRTDEERALADFWHSYADLVVEFERGKRTDPARVARLRAACEARYGRQDRDDHRACIASRWTDGGGTVSSPLGVVEYGYLEVGSHPVDSAYARLSQTDPAKTARLRTLCEAQTGRDGFAASLCVVGRWNG